jgi:acylpyruvate hydrolase
VRTARWRRAIPLGAGQDAGGPALDLSCAVDGTLMQSANTSDLVFSPAATVAYVSSILTLRPGDVLALGTPGGVGHARQPPCYLRDGEVLVTTIAGLGQCRNRCVAEKAA